MKAWKNHPNTYDDNLAKPPDDNSAFNSEEDAQAAGECQHGRLRVDRSSTASGRAAREAISMIEPHGRMTRNAALGHAGCRSVTSTSANAGPE